MPDDIQKILRTENESRRRLENTKNVNLSSGCDDGRLEGNANQHLLQSILPCKKCPIFIMCVFRIWFMFWVLRCTDPFTFIPANINLRPIIFQQNSLDVFLFWCRFFSTTMGCESILVVLQQVGKLNNIFDIQLFKNSLFDGADCILLQTEPIGNFKIAETLAV